MTSVKNRHEPTRSDAPDIAIQVTHSADSAVRHQQAVTLHAVRRWCSAEDSPLHEQARADRVGESLEPGGGGAVWPLKSEVARCDGMAPGSKRSAERTLFLNTVGLRFAQTSTKKQSL
jgi:hypothetical protein